MSAIVPEEQPENTLVYFIFKAIEYFSLEQQKILLLALGSSIGESFSIALFKDAEATFIKNNRPQKHAQLTALACYFSAPINIIKSKRRSMNLNTDIKIGLQFNLSPLLDAYRYAIKEFFHIDVSHPNQKEDHTVKKYQIWEDYIPTDIFEKIIVPRCESIVEDKAELKTIPNIKISEQFLVDYDRAGISAISIDGKKYDCNNEKFFPPQEEPPFKKNKFIFASLLQDFCKYYKHACEREDALFLLSFCMTQASCFVDSALNFNDKFTLPGATPTPILILDGRGDRSAFFDLRREIDGTALLKVIVRRDKITHVYTDSLIECKPENSFLESEITFKIDIKNKDKRKQITPLPSSATYKYHIEPIYTKVAKQDAPAIVISSFVDSVGSTARRLQTTARKGVSSIMSTPHLYRNNIAVLA